MTTKAAGATVLAQGLRVGAISVELPGPIAVGICVGVALGVWVALAIIWPRTRPPGRR